MKTREVIRRLQAEGFTFLRHGAEHDVYLCSCGQHTVAVVRHTETSAGVVGGYSKRSPCLKKSWWR
jgi:predicted RNA binding protein YcfA (HicA-like mRNA interferase family)